MRTYFMAEPNRTKTPTQDASGRTDSPPLPPLLERIRERTPARLLTGRTGAAYRTSTWLQLRRDHAAARDAVCAELDLRRDLGASFADEWALFEVHTLAANKQDFLLQPELGRSLDEAARQELIEHCPTAADLQPAIADGLSTAAVRAQIPELLPLLAAETRHLGWRLGQPFFIRHGRVGVLNDIGELLDPAVVVLLIGERPGLATAESLSAYMAYRPRAGHDDSHRNVISNIHARGVSLQDAARRIALLAAQMIALGISGPAIKEQDTRAPRTLASSPIS
jgi:ethanolamine ammonia-lyase small subunit